MSTDATGNAHSAKVTGIMGATGCGKSYFLRQCLANPARKRTMIWSPKEAIDQYAGLYRGTKVCTTSSQVLAALMAARGGPVHIVIKPPLIRKKDKALFGAVCKMAMAARNITIVAEEVGTVTEPNGGPDGWYELITMGRGYGVEVFGLSQRPVSIDKDFFSNMSRLHVGRLLFDDDVKTCARALRVPVADVQNLIGHAWIERDVLTGNVTRG